MIVKGLLKSSQTGGPSASGWNVSSEIDCGSIGIGARSAPGRRSAMAAMAASASASMAEPITLCPLAPISRRAPLASRSRARMSR